MGHPIIRYDTLKEQKRNVLESDEIVENNHPYTLLYGRKNS